MQAHGHSQQLRHTLVQPAEVPAVNVAMYDAAAAAFPLVYRVSRGGSLAAPIWNGEPRGAEPATASARGEGDGRWTFVLTVPAESWGGSGRLRPGWALFYGEERTALWPVGGDAWPVPRLWHPLSPSQFGRLVSD